MIQVAIYARYSSDKQRDASIDDQVRNCRAFAEREGWKGKPRIYADKAISGAKRDRPEYQQMINDAEEKQFDVLLVDDLSRLSRDNAETLKVLERLRFWGVRIIGVSDGYDSASKSHKVVSGVRGIVNDVYLDDLREKTHRGLAGKALHGYHTGGRAYGYRHVPIEDPKRNDQFGRPVIVAVKREVDPKQAEVVRRIFKDFADGRGYREIAARLNAGGIKPMRCKAWGGSSIRPMLRNELYIGRDMWNMTEGVRNPDTKRRTFKARPEDEWIITEAPELRIISDDLWEQVRKRREALEGAHKTSQEDGKKRPGKVPVHLFTGLLKCGQCGGKFIVANRSHYMCANRSNRRQDDKAWCDSPSVHKDELEQKLLYAIRKELFDQKSFEAFKVEVRRVLAERLKSRNKDPAKSKRDLEKLDREIAGMIDLAKMGKASPALAEALFKAEADKRRREAELDPDLPPALANLEDLLEDALARYARVAYSLEDFSRRDVTKARNLIRALVGGSIVLEPIDDGGLQARLQGSYEGLIKLVQEASSNGKSRMVAGAGFEPATFRL